MLYMRVFDTNRVRADKLLDYIPAVGAFSNGIDLAEKVGLNAIRMIPKWKEAGRQNPFYSYLESKSVWYCLAAAILPIVLPGFGSYLLWRYNNSVAHQKEEMIQQLCFIEDKYASAPLTTGDEGGHKKTLAKEKHREIETFLKGIPTAFRKDAEFMKKLIGMHPEAIKYVDPSILKDTTFIQQAQQFLPMARANKSVIRFLIAHDARWIKLAFYDDLKNDHFMAAAVKINPDVLKHRRQDLAASKEFLLKIIEENPRALAVASEKLRRNVKFVYAAMQVNGLALEHVIEDLKEEDSIVGAALRQNPAAKQFLPERFQK